MQRQIYGQLWTGCVELVRACVVARAGLQAGLCVGL